MKLPWFKRYGLLYLPITLIGGAILVAAIALAVYLFIDIDSNSHSVSDTLMNFVFNLIFIYLGYSLIAYITSHKPKNP